MDDDDFLSELGIVSKDKKPSPNAAPSANGSNVNKQQQQPPRATPVAVRTGSNPMYLETDPLGKKKKKNPPARQQTSDGQDDLKSWLAASPRDDTAAQMMKKNTKDASQPVALESDDTTFEPLSEKERFETYVTAFDVDEGDFSLALKEEEPFLIIARQKMRNSEVATRFVASWKQQCGGNLCEASFTPRSKSFLSALVLYHDPKLWAFLASNKFQYDRPCLYEFFAPGEGSGLSPVFECWDACIMNGFPGFDTPTQGTIFYSLALMLLNRDGIMSASASTLLATLDQLRVTTDPVDAVIVGCRAAKLTPEHFLRLSGESEIDWTEYEIMLSGENERSPAPPPSTLQKQNSTMASLTSRATSLFQRQSTAGTDGGEKKERAASIDPAPVAPGSATATSSVSSWMGSWAKTSAPTSASLSAGFNSFTQKMSEALQGSIDDDDSPRPAAVRAARPRTASVENRQLFLIAYGGARKLGLQLGQTPQGLTVLGFDRSQNGALQLMGEAEQEGTVQVGDVMHSVNWVSVTYLPPSVAGKVISRQDRPLYVTFSTLSPSGRNLPSGLSVEARAMQHGLLKQRLLSFYSRYGQEKTSDISNILSLYGKHERALLRGLWAKYGEPVPGDEKFASDLVLISAAEAIMGGLARAADEEEDLDDLLFVDVRTKDDRSDTGIFPATFSLSFDDKDDKMIKSIVKSVGRRSSRTKVCLLGSGTSRMYNLVDPSRAKTEASIENERLLKAARKLAEAGVTCVCAIRGGFAECFREAKIRLPHFTSLPEGSQGLLFKTCDAFANVNLKDTESLANFAIGYFSDFAAPLLPANQQDSQSANEPQVQMGAMGQGLPRGVSQDSIQQNLRETFSTFQMSSNLSLASVSMPKLFKQTSGASGGDRASNDANKPQQSPMNNNADLFSIDDD